MDKPRRIIAVELWPLRLPLRQPRLASETVAEDVVAAPVVIGQGMLRVPPGPGHGAAASLRMGRYGWKDAA